MLDVFEDMSSADDDELWFVVVFFMNQVRCEAKPQHEKCFFNLLHFIFCPVNVSFSTYAKCGVGQGSVFGPLYVYMWAV